MESTTELSGIVDKTRELCQAILDQPEVQALRADVDKFLDCEQSQKQYRDLVELSEYLNHQQSQGVQITEEQKQKFESEREALLNNPTAKSFLDAQQNLHQIQETVNQFVTKTFELGRVPNPEDLDQGSCGEGCGCHH